MPKPQSDVKHGNVKRKTGRAARRGHAETVAARRLRAIQLRRSGANYEQIGRATGVSTMQASRDVKAAREATLQVVAEEAHEYVATELDRLDGLLVPLAAAIRAGSVPAIREARKIGESRRKLLGLDNTKPQEIIIAAAAAEPPLERVSDADLLARMQRAAEVLALNGLGQQLLDAEFFAADAAPPPSPRTPAEEYAEELARR